MKYGQISVRERGSERKQQPRRPQRSVGGGGLAVWPEHRGTVNSKRGLGEQSFGNHIKDVSSSPIHNEKSQAKICPIRPTPIILWSGAQNIAEKSKRYPVMVLHYQTNLSILEFQHLYQGTFWCGRYKSTTSPSKLAWISKPPNLHFRGRSSTPPTLEQLEYWLRTSLQDTNPVTVKSHRTS